VLGSRLVFKTKKTKDGTILKRKVRFVVRGFEQIHGRDFDQTFAGVCKAATWKIAIALAARFDLEIIQMDVDVAFLNSKTNEENIYCELPPGWRESGVDSSKDQVAKL
jgi:Reverse transcriptase (RNA-dependent DNA polymerase)